MELPLLPGRHLVHAARPYPRPDDAQNGLVFSIDRHDRMNEKPQALAVAGQSEPGTAPIGTGKVDFRRILRRHDPAAAASLRRAPRKIGQDRLGGHLGRAQEPVRRYLGAHPNVTLLGPLDYVPFVDLMRRAYVILTDSGGIQEEGPSLGKPILVLREKTERPEAVEAGTVKLVGTDVLRITTAVMALLDDPEECTRMSRVHNPYGDGQACASIEAGLGASLGEFWGG